MSATHRARREAGGLWGLEAELDDGQLRRLLSAEDRRDVGSGDGRAGDLDVVSAAPLGAATGSRWRLIVRPVDEATARRARDAGRLDVTVTATGLVASVPAAPDLLPRDAQTLDYRARDFDSVRASMLSAIAAETGSGNDANPVGQTTALVEVLAFVTDSLSYAQDAVATEANLSTARRRISVTRHAAMLDYHVGEGTNARTWVRIEVDCRAPFVLPARTPLVGRRVGLAGRVDVAAWAAAQAEVLDAPPQIRSAAFETVHAVTLHPYVRAHEVVTPGGEPIGLPEGAVTALVAGRDRRLRPGQLVSFEQRDSRRAGHVARLTDVEVQGPATLLTWSSADAARPMRAPIDLFVGNLVLADHGATVPPVASPHPWPELAPAGRRRSVPLPGRDLTFAADPPPDSSRRAAAASLAVDSTAARLSRPAVELTRHERGRTHAIPVVPSLLDGTGHELLAVVEMDDDRTGRVRFGDADGPSDVPARVRVRRRVGGGPSGNVAAHTMCHVVTDDVRVTGVVQPVAAVGGQWPESLSAVRLHAPQRYRRNDRLVTAADVESAVRSVAGVLDAQVRVAPDGPGADVEVRLHTGWPQQPEVAQTVRELLATASMLGTRVEVRVASPIDVRVEVRVAAERLRAPKSLRADLEARLRDHLVGPARFGFGAALHPTDIVQWALAVPGVRSAEVQLRAAAGARAAPGYQAAPGREPTSAGSVCPGPGQIVRVGDGESDGRGLHVHLRWSGSA